MNLASLTDIVEAGGFFFFFKISVASNIIETRMIFIVLTMAFFLPREYAGKKRRGVGITIIMVKKNLLMFPKVWNYFSNI